MTYSPAQAKPSDMPNLVRYLFRELTRIGQELDSLNNPVPTLHVEPERPLEGFMVIADGTDWNPGFGNGLYIYLNSAWTFIV